MTDFVVEAPIAGSSKELLPSRTQLAALSTEADILQALDELEDAETEVEASLEAILAAPERVDAPLDQIDALRPLISSLTSESLVLHEVVSERAQVADRISGKVRVLDLEQSRVKECIDRVGAVAELKNAIAALHKAVDSKDWEEATRCVQRARAVDQKVVTSHFAEAIVPTPDVPEPPSAALASFVNSLTDIFLEAFNAAASKREEATATRFFKLFPLLGPESEDAGLSAYATFVCTLITQPARVKGPSSALGPLTALLEQVALIIAQHQPVVERHYGAGKMARVVRQLNAELDRQSLRIFASWEEDRRIVKLLSDSRAYRFPHLTALHLPAPTQSSSSAIGSGVGSAAAAAVAAHQAATAALPASLRSLANVRSGAGTPVSAGSPATVHASAGLDDDLPDLKNMDAVIGELAAISGRWHTYRRFLYSRLVSDDALPLKPNGVSKSVNGDEGPHGQANGSAAADDLSPADREAVATIESTELKSKVADHLKDVYWPLEAWYFRVGMEKAHAADEPDQTARPLLSSALDDTFYMLKKLLNRLIQTAHLPTLGPACVAARDLLQKDFADVLKRRIEACIRDVAAVANLRADEKERREREARDAFIVYLNDLDTASEYVVRLVSEAVESQALDDAFFLDAELAEAKAHLEGVKRAHDHLRAILRAGLEQLFGQLVRPKLRPLIADCYKDVNYMLDEEKYAEAEYQDLVGKRFVRAWDALIEGYKELLTHSNFEKLFIAMINFLVRPWETIVRNLRFTELGALRFDRDLRAVVSHLAAQTSFGAGTLRDGFARLQQIATLLQLESDDDAEALVAGSEISWRLTPQEIESVLTLRVY